MSPAALNAADIARNVALALVMLNNEMEKVAALAREIVLTEPKGSVPNEVVIELGNVLVAAGKFRSWCSLKNLRVP